MKSILSPVVNIVVQEKVIRLVNARVDGMVSIVMVRTPSNIHPLGS